MSGLKKKISLRTPLHLSTHEQLQMHGCILSNETTDSLVLKHQAINIQSAG